MVKEYPVGHAFYEKKGYKPITIHIPGELHKRLKQFTKDNRSSIEAFIHQLLKDNLPKK